MGMRANLTVTESSRVGSVLLAVWTTVAAALAQAPGAKPASPVAAQIVIDGGQAYLHKRTGKPLAIPSPFDLREGDIVTTSEKVRGRFVLRSGERVDLGPLHRYRVGRDAIWEPSGPKGWRRISAPTAVEAPARPLGPPPPGGLVAKVRVIVGPVFQRAETWPQELPIQGGVSLSIGDDLRVGRGGRVQIQFTTKGFLLVLGPALVTVLADRLVIDSGQGMARGLGDRDVVFGPYRLEPGDNLFTFQTIPDGLLVGALGGIMPVFCPDEPPLYLAPGRRGVLRRGAKTQVERLDIRKEALSYEALLTPPRPAAARAQGAPEAAGEPAPAASPRASKPAAKRPDARERKAPPKEPVIVEDVAVTILPLRDRVKALDSPESRYFYAKKREELETRSLRDEYTRELEGKEQGEVEAFKQYKLGRAHSQAHQDLDDYRNSKELAFQERQFLKGPERDQAVRSERERLFGRPLWVFTRQYEPGVAGDRERAKAIADQLTLQIRILSQNGGSASAIAQLEARRQKVLDLADRESDAQKEQFRIQMEPYR